MGSDLANVLIDEEQIDARLGELAAEIDRDYAGRDILLVGVLRAMADDYGALVLLDHAEGPGGRETVRIHLLAADFAEGRRFDLVGEG